MSMRSMAVVLSLLVPALAHAQAEVEQVQERNERWALGGGLTLAPVVLSDGSLGALSPAPTVTAERRIGSTWLRLGLVTAVTQLRFDTGQSTDAASFQLRVGARKPLLAGGPVELSVYADATGLYNVARAFDDSSASRNIGAGVGGGLIAQVALAKQVDLRLTAELARLTASRAVTTAPLNSTAGTWVLSGGLTAEPTLALFFRF
ncbi:MAG: hypothetical protein JST54_04100 [Deltaproteobacteria bacterium]|nr:hypothetical protein [Deltaproteobacteria bacterium]